MKIQIHEIHINKRMRSVDHSKAEEIADSIKEIGLLNPITISEDHTLIAGLHRLNACKLLGHTEIEANIIPLSGLKRELAEIDENLMRHDLHYIDRGNHMARRKEIYEEIYPETKPGQYGHKGNIIIEKPEKVVSTFSEDTAKKVGVSESVIKQELQISNNISPEIKEQIKERDISKTEALKLARIEPEKQKEVMQRASEAKKSIDAVIKEIKREEVRAKVAEEVKNTVLIPDGKFDIILADPPWQYTPAVSNRMVENHYPTMETKEICAIKVPSNDTSILFLWATTGKLPDAFEVMRAWGYEYKSSAVWNKMIVGMGYYFRGQHEFLLVGTKGNPGTPEPENRYSSVIEAKRTEHSKKPDIVYDMIEKMYPNRKYLELFARSKHSEAWEVWGNQI